MNVLIIDVFSFHGSFVSSLFACTACATLSVLRGFFFFFWLWSCLIVSSVSLRLADYGFCVHASVVTVIIANIMWLRHLVYCEIFGIGDVGFGLVISVSGVLSALNNSRVFVEVLLIRLHNRTIVYIVGRCLSLIVLDRGGMQVASRVRCLLEAKDPLLRMKKLQTSCLCMYCSVDFLVICSDE